MIISRIAVPSKCSKRQENFDMAITRLFSLRLVTMTMMWQFFSQTMRQKSSAVPGSGPWAAIYGFGPPKLCIQMWNENLRHAGGVNLPDSNLAVVSKLYLDQKSTFLNKRQYTQQLQKCLRYCVVGSCSNLAKCAENRRFAVVSKCDI